MGKKVPFSYEICSKVLSLLKGIWSDKTQCILIKHAIFYYVAEVLKREEVANATAAGTTTVNPVQEATTGTTVDPVRNAFEQYENGTITHDDLWKVLGQNGNKWKTRVWRASRESCVCKAVLRLLFFFNCISIFAF